MTKKLCKQKRKPFDVIDVAETRLIVEAARRRRGKIAGGDARKLKLIISNLTRIGLTPAECSVLDFIKERTLTFRKLTEAITIPQIQYGVVSSNGRIILEGTSLSGPTVSKAIKRMKDEGRISVLPGMGRKRIIGINYLWRPDHEEFVRACKKKVALIKHKKALARDRVHKHRATKQVSDPSGILYRVRHYVMEGGNQTRRQTPLDDTALFIEVNEMLLRGDLIENQIKTGARTWLSWMLKNNPDLQHAINENPDKKALKNLPCNANGLMVCYSPQGGIPYIKEEIEKHRKHPPEKSGRDFKDVGSEEKENEGNEPEPFYSHNEPSHSVSDIPFPAHKNGHTPVQPDFPTSTLQTPEERFYEHLDDVIGPCWENASSGSAICISPPAVNLRMIDRTLTAMQPKVSRENIEKLIANSVRRSAQARKRRAAKQGGVPSLETLRSALSIHTHKSFPQASRSFRKADLIILQATLKRWVEKNPGEDFNYLDVLDTAFDSWHILACTVFAASGIDPTSTPPIRFISTDWAYSELVKAYRNRHHIKKGAYGWEVYAMRDFFMKMDGTSEENAMKRAKLQHQRNYAKRNRLAREDVKMMVHDDGRIDTHSIQHRRAQTFIGNPQPSNDLQTLAKRETPPTEKEVMAAIPEKYKGEPFIVSCLLKALCTGRVASEQRSWMERNNLCNPKTPHNQMIELAIKSIDGFFKFCQMPVDDSFACEEETGW